MLQGYLDWYFFNCPSSNQILAPISYYNKISCKVILIYYEKKEVLHLVVEGTAIQVRNSNIKFLLVRSES